TRTRGGRRGLFYLTPPPGALRLRREVRTDEMHSGRVRVRLLRAPDRVTTPVVHLDVLVTNTSDGVCWTQWVGGRHPLHVSYRVVRDGELVLFDCERSRLPGSFLGPGESCQTSVRLVLPTAPGQYVVEVLPVVELIGWGSEPQRLGVVVRPDNGNGFAAELTPAP